MPLTHPPRHFETPLAEVRRDRGADILCLAIFPVLALAFVFVLPAQFGKHPWTTALFFLNIGTYGYASYRIWKHHKYRSCIRLYPDRLEIWDGGWKTEYPLDDIQSIQNLRFLGIPATRYKIVSKYSDQARWFYHTWTA